MKTKIIQCIPAVLALVAIGWDYFSLWCIFTTRMCYGTVISHISLSVTQPLYFFSLFFLPLALILIFVPRNIFNSWLKLAVWVIPLSIFFIAGRSVNFTGMGINFFPFYRDDAARLSGEIFTGLSLILIIWKFIVARRTKNKN